MCAMNGCGQKQQTTTGPGPDNGSGAGSFFDGIGEDIRMDDETIYIETARNDFQFWLAVASVALAFWALIRK